MLPWYAWAGILIGGASVVCCGLLGALIVFVEVYDHRRDREARARAKARLAEDRKVADLESLWEMSA